MFVLSPYVFDPFVERLGFIFRVTVNFFDTQTAAIGIKLSMNYRMWLSDGHWFAKIHCFAPAKVWNRDNTNCEMEDGFLAECSAKIPFGYQAAYRGVYGTKMNGAPCIVKSLRDILAGAGDVSPEQVAGATGRFRDECALLSKLRHPNVLQFLGVQVGSEASDITLVLECPHTTLDDCLGRRKAALSLTVALSILRDVSLGLLYLHSRASPSTAHGDLHARNVLLMKDMTAKIADLGATKILGYSLAAPETLDHLPSDAIAALRTAPFLSNSSYKVDIFSFGVLCLHVAVDSAGNEGESLPIEAMLDHAQHSPLHPLVLNCLHDDQEKRPSAGEVCTEMDGLCSKFPRESKDILEVMCV